MTPRTPPPGHPGHRDWLVVDAADPAHAEGVLAALCEIFATRAGRALLRPIYASGRAVRIVRPTATAPPNAAARPADLRAATAEGHPTGESTAEGQAILGTGAGSDSFISFAATDWPNPSAPEWPSADALLFALLIEATRQIAGSAHPSGYAETGAAEAAGESLAAYLSERGLAPAARGEPGRREPGR